MVAIAGGSGSGKTWLAERLQARLRGRAARLSLDDFYKDCSHLPPERRAKINFDNPAAIDWDLFQKVLANCLKWRSSKIPVYDFRTHCRRRRARVFKPKPVILVDGLWLLRRPALRRIFNLRIFLDCPAQTRLRRRIARDLVSRGRTRSSILEQFRKTVEPMHARYVAPQIRRADVVLAGNWGTREADNLAGAIRSLLAGSRARRRRQPSNQ